jgi:hypothetical protein
MLAVSSNGKTPSVCLIINKTYLINDLRAYYIKFPIDPVDRHGAIVTDHETLLATIQNDYNQIRLTIIVMMPIMTAGLTGFLYMRLSKAQLPSPAAGQYPDRCVSAFHHIDTRRSQKELTGCAGLYWTIFHVSPYEQL